MVRGTHQNAGHKEIRKALALSAVSGGELP